MSADGDSGQVGVMRVNGCTNDGPVRGSGLEWSPGVTLQKSELSRARVGSVDRLSLALSVARRAGMEVCDCWRRSAGDIRDAAARRWGGAVLAGAVSQEEAGHDGGLVADSRFRRLRCAWRLQQALELGQRRGDCACQKAS